MDVWGGRPRPPILTQPLISIDNFKGGRGRPPHTCTSRSSHSQRTIQPYLENGSFLQLQPVVAEYRSHHGHSSSCCRTHSTGIRIVMRAALSFALDFAFVANGQAVLSGDRSDRRHQRRPSALRFDFVKAEQQARMKSTSHGANMPLDPGAMENHGFVGPHHVFFQLRFEALARPDLVDIQPFIEADQERGPVSDGVWRS